MFVNNLKTKNKKLLIFPRLNFYETRKQTKKI